MCDIHGTILHMRVKCWILAIILKDTLYTPLEHTPKLDAVPFPSEKPTDPTSLFTVNMVKEKILGQFLS